MTDTERIDWIEKHLATVGPCELNPNEKNPQWFYAEVNKPSWSRCQDPDLRAAIDARIQLDNRRDRAPHHAAKGGSMTATEARKITDAAIDKKKPDLERDVLPFVFRKIQEAAERGESSIHWPPDPKLTTGELAATECFVIIPLTQKF